MWNRFQEYTKNQVLELCENYGKLDILWFDAGWVSESNGQDIELERSLRKHVRFSRGFSPLTVQSAVLTKTT